MANIPNWCYNELIITGDNNELLRFKKFSHTKVNRYGKKEENVLDTNQFIPYPKKFIKQTEKSLKHNARIKKLKNSKEHQALKELGDKQMKYMGDGFNKGGYEWSCRFWGSKWGICNPELLEETDKRLSYNFDTAWCPVFPVIKKMTKMFPILTFQISCKEESDDFDFEETIKNGKVLRKIVRINKNKNI